MSVCPLGQWAQRPRHRHRHRHRGLSDSRKSRFLGKDAAGWTGRVVGGDICLPDRSGRIQLGDHVRDAPEGGGCLETNASHGRSEGRSSGGCKVMFLTESSGCSPGVGLLWTSLRPQHWLSRPWRPYLRHFKGFRPPIRWISRAVGLLQHPWGYPPSDDLARLCQF